MEMDIVDSLQVLSDVFMAHGHTARFPRRAWSRDHAQPDRGQRAQEQPGPRLKGGWKEGTVRALLPLQHRAAAGGRCPPSPRAQAGPQLLRVTLQGQQDPLRNQTAVVDKARSTVTYYITSRSNLSAVVLYDSRNGYVCYKPLEQRACYLRRMEPWDLQMALNTSEHSAEQPLQPNNQTKFYREFLGIVAGQQLEPGALGEAVQSLCEHSSILRVRRAHGPGRQRLIYLCIDICFPSNICVSICFYYLPE
ncbi:BRICHOS domain-containing protein 5 [Passerculus sandwichensis]